MKYRYRVTGEIVGLQVGQVIEQDHEIARGFRNAVERLSTDKPLTAAKKKGKASADKKASAELSGGAQDAAG